MSLVNFKNYDKNELSKNQLIGLSALLNFWLAFSLVA